MSKSLELSQESLASLVDASEAINDSHTLDETLDAIARSAAAVLRAEAASVVMLDKTRGKQIFKAAVGDRSDQLIGAEYEEGEGISGKVLASGKAAIVNDTSGEKTHFKGIDHLVGFETRSLIAAPLIHRDEPLGVVEILNPVGGKSFEEKDRLLAQMFANLAAIAVANSKRFDRLQKDNHGLKQSLLGGGQMVGDSSPMAEVSKLIHQVASSPATVLLLGETGTGKEVAARRIHMESERRDRSFVAVNCAALSPSLLESELFGHEAGAFTGATSRKLGRFELADGGSIFLDEIGELTSEVQVKLLRVLQEREIVRVGGTEVIGCDVRVIAATNRDLSEEMKAGRFRDDLYYRLNVFPIEMPPLRNRKDDIPLLSEHFLNIFSSDMNIPRPVLSKDAVKALKAYEFHGNVRELQNILERACLLCRGSGNGDGPAEISVDSLPREVRIIAGEDQEENDASGGSLLAAGEKEMILKALNENNWNQSRAAESLGISRDNIRYRMKKYGIKK